MDDDGFWERVGSVVDKLAATATMEAASVEMIADAVMVVIAPYVAPSEARAFVLPAVLLMAELSLDRRHDAGDRYRQNEATRLEEEATDAADMGPS